MDSKPVSFTVEINWLSGFDSELVKRFEHMIYQIGCWMASKRAFFFSEANTYFWPVNNSYLAWIFMYIFIITYPIHILLQVLNFTTHAPRPRGLPQTRQLAAPVSSQSSKMPNTVDPGGSQSHRTSRHSPPQCHNSDTSFVRIYHLYRKRPGIMQLKKHMMPALLVKLELTYTYDVRIHVPVAPSQAHESWWHPSFESRPGGCDFLTGFYGVAICGKRRCLAWRRGEDEVGIMRKTCEKYGKKGHHLIGNIDQKGPKSCTCLFRRSFITPVMIMGWRKHVPRILDVDSEGLAHPFWEGTSNRKRAETNSKSQCRWHLDQRHNASQLLAGTMTKPHHRGLSTVSGHKWWQLGRGPKEPKKRKKSRAGTSNRIKQRRNNYKQGPHNQRKPKQPLQRTEHIHCISTACRMVWSLGPESCVWRGSIHLIMK